MHMLLEGARADCRKLELDGLGRVRVIRRADAAERKEPHQRLLQQHEYTCLNGRSQSMANIAASLVVEPQAGLPVDGERDVFVLPDARKRDGLDDLDGTHAGLRDSLAPLSLALGGAWYARHPMMVGTAVDAPTLR